MQQPPAGGAMVPPPTQMVPDQQHYAQQYQQQPPHQWMMPPQQPVPPPAGWAPQPVPPPAPQMPVQQYPATAAAAAAPSSPAGEIRSLWIGDLQPWMDENYIFNCFAHTSQVVTAKVIRNKQTGISEGYGFVEFASRAAAETILQTYNGTPMPSTEQSFRLNWAAMGSGDKRQDDGSDFTIFVGDLAPDVTDYYLQETFKAYYGSVKGAKVVTDRATGRSKGYGFVRFGDESEHFRAMTEMNGVMCSSRPMRIGPAATKKPVTGMQYQKATYQSTEANPGESDPNNTTIFVGALDPSVTEDQLQQVFSQIGDLVHVKIARGKHCGFVQFANRASAEKALSQLNGTILGGKNVRLSWGHSQSNKQAQPDQTQWSGGYYGYGQAAQGYETYGYAPPAAQDPNVYYGGYPGYGNYQQPGAYQQAQQ